MSGPGQWNVNRTLFAYLCHDILWFQGCPLRCSGFFGTLQEVVGLELSPWSLSPRGRALNRTAHMFSYSAFMKKHAIVVKGLMGRVFLSFPTHSNSTEGI